MYVDEEIAKFFGVDAPLAYASIFNEGNAAAHGFRYAMDSAARKFYKAPSGIYLTLKDAYGERSDRKRGDFYWTCSLLTILYFVATLEPIYD
ncbi:MAG: hypothetical protein EOO38_31720 [Cytophagaceae bacterium]|nr:MAG: hypothetical protein EOO38_31720 [Cytophagaceae bacterium]